MSAFIAHYEAFETDELRTLLETPEHFTAEAHSAIASVLTSRGVALPAPVPQSEPASEPMEVAPGPAVRGRWSLFARFRRRPESESLAPIVEVDPQTQALLEQEGGLGFTELMKAAADDDVDRLAELIQRGADVDERDRRGGTALAYAARYGRRSAVEFLLEAGGNPNIPTAGGRTPAQLAHGNGHLEVAALLRAVAAPHGGCAGVCPRCND
jgi:hypothetical protein